MTVAQDSAAGPGDRSPGQIKADIEATQQRLAATVDGITDRVAPKNVLARTESALKAQVIDPATGPRYARIAAAAGVVLGIIALRVWRARR